MDISIVLPTRGRAAGVQELVASVAETADAFAQIEFCFYIDSDDESTRAMMDTLIGIYGTSHIKYTTADTDPNLSQMWNIAYERLATGSIIMHCGDDIRFRTRHWDTLIKGVFEAYTDKIVLVYGNDGIQGAKLATHSFVHRRWIEASGFWLPPYFKSDYNDMWLDDVAKRIGRRHYLPELYTEHMHFSVGKMALDDTTQRRLENHKHQHPESIYNGKADERMEHVNRLRTVMQM
jgi:hypothetical protein